MNILVTGGSGYIGSHIVIELIQSGYTPIIIDPCPKSKKTIQKIYEITLFKPPLFNNFISKKILNDISKIYELDAVIHLAGYKSVNESVRKPTKYFRNNIYSTIMLLEHMEKNKINNLIFSSSATVYGHSVIQPITENCELTPDNPYGSTKVIIESMIESLCNNNAFFKAISLRYFNPIGSHNSYKLNMNTDTDQNNIIPVLIRSLKQKFEFTIFGNDYDTHDGTCLRDYIHVVDLSKAHIKALKHLNTIENHLKLNIGTGKPHSVLEIVKTFKKINKLDLKYNFGKRRAGDVPVCYADCSRANKLLKWKAKLDLKQMCLDSYKPFLQK